MSTHDDIVAMGQQAKAASYQFNDWTSEQKNKTLLAMADTLDAHASEIKAENEKDIIAAREQGLSDALIDRLVLTDERIGAMAEGLRIVAKLPDPVGTILSEHKHPNGMLIQKQSVPIGVIGVIYESRPNVTVDVAGLCLKAGNVVILRGGKEALHSNRILAALINSAGKQCGLPEQAIQLIATTDKAAIKTLVQLRDIIDLVIPRGGEGLINAVVEMAQVPVIKHYKGLCHIYVDASANLDHALSIVENAKCQRPGVCNAIETLLVHQEIADVFLPRVIKCLEEKGTELRGDDAVQAIAPVVTPATEMDWSAEYLDLVLSIKVVDDCNAAVSHINTYGSHHSDAVIADDLLVQDQFKQQVDSAVVYVNASTRFTDGGEFGMGAEIGISTDKLHARGPMGLAELTTYKYIVMGQGQIR